MVSRLAHCGLLLILVAGSSTVVPAEEPAAASMTLGEFLFAVTDDTRSLRRTNHFLDVARIDKHLQVALVVDGTEGMEEDLASLQQNLLAFLRNLQEVRRDPVPTVAAALVVYRDSDSPSGPVEVLSRRFDTDLASVGDALQAIQPEPGGNGTLFFASCEAMDQGVHAALAGLNWRQDEGVSRWVIVAGDSAPYPEGFRFRKFDNDQLITLARNQEVAIYGMATGSHADPGDRSRLRSFLGELARATGGHTVDTLDVQSIRYWMQKPLKMPPITQADIDRRRQQGLQAGEPHERLRIAVLPHLPRGQMSFATDRTEVLIATHLRERLTRLSGTEVVPPGDVQQACAALATESTTTDAQWLGRLGERLAVDYLVWGSERTSFDYLVIESSLHTADGQPLAQATEAIKPVSDAGRLMVLNAIFRGLCGRSAMELKMLGRLGHAQVLEAAVRTRSQAAVLHPLANDSRAQSAILAGLEQLEYALAIVKPDVEAAADPARSRLDSAIEHLQRAVVIEPHSPYAHLLLANCYYNRDRHRDGVTALSEQVRDHLEQAHRGLDTLPSPADPVRLEVEAQYALLVVKDIETAIRLYRELAGASTAENGRFALRARWMLAGIHLGEWDVMSYGWNQVAPHLAREQILSILAFSPNSPEAAFYQQCLRNSAPGHLDVPVGQTELAGTY